MNNTVSFLGLVSIGFLGFTNLSVNAQIPQSEIQSIVLQGESNQVSQKINQNLNLNFIYLPQIKESVIPNFNIHGTSLDNPNNQVTQTINQSVLGLTLIETSLVSFGLNNLLQNDNTLTGKQFITQEISIEGNDNSLTQQSSQTLTDFVWLDQSSGITGDEDFSQFLDKLLANHGLDSLQFSLQDTFVFGNDNIVFQTIDQTFNSFIFTSYNLNSFFDTNITNEEMGLDPVQFTVQKTKTSFIQEPLMVPSKNNLIAQTLNQVISGISFINPSILSAKQGLIEPNNSTIVGINSSVDFDINDFINGILNDTIVNATQTNRQRIQTIGNENIVMQENKQALVVSVPEPSLTKMMVVLLVMIGIEWCYEKR